MADPLDDIIRLRDEMNRHSATWYFVPRHWKARPALRNLAWSTPRRWDPANRRGIPTRCGLYAFLLVPEVDGAPEGVYVLYIGMTEKQDLRTRYGQYAREMRDPRGRTRIRLMLRNWPKHLWYCYAVTRRAKAKAAEKALRAMLIPPFNDDIAADLNAAKKAF